MLATVASWPPAELAALRRRRAEAGLLGRWRATLRRPRLRLAALAAAVAVPAMAAPGEWQPDFLAGDEVPPALVPMAFETPGESFPGSAFYYLEDGGYGPLPIEAAIRHDTAPAPVSAAIGPAARALRAAGSSADVARAQQCLTMAIYYEAASESDAGQRAVAQVVLNRVAHPSYPATVCGVVFQGSERRTGCQFTFTCDGSLARKPSRVFWDRASSVARQALAGAVYAPVGLATHYHTVAIHPYWADSLHAVTTIGAHIFYRWRGAAGQREAFTVAYRGGEPAPAPHPRSADPAPAAETDPVVLARAYEGRRIEAAALAGLPPPAYSAAIEARGGEALFRGDNLPQAGAVSPLLERSGQWLDRP
jgi:hypothetical protein